MPVSPKVSKSPMMTFFLKTAIVCAIPKLVDAASDLFTPTEPEKNPKPEYTLEEVNVLIEHAIKQARKEDAELQMDLELGLQPIDPKELLEVIHADSTNSPQTDEPVVTPRQVGGNTIRKSESGDAMRFIDNAPTAEVTPGKPIARHTHKAHDMHKFDQSHFDYICKRHAETVAHNKLAPKGKNIMMTELRDQLNNELGLDKSMTSYSKVYLGHINRDDLPTSF